MKWQQKRSKRSKRVLLQVFYWLFKKEPKLTLTVDASNIVVGVVFEQTDYNKIERQRERKIEVHRGRFKQIYMDIVAPPAEFDGNHYILTIVDRFETTARSALSTKNLCNDHRKNFCKQLHLLFQDYSYHTQTQENLLHRHLFFAGGRVI